MYPIGIITGEVDYPELEKVIETIRRLSPQSWIVNATEEDLRLGNPIYTNVILLGALLGSEALPLNKKTMEAALKEELPNIFDVNRLALQRGLDFVRDAMRE